MLTTRPRNKGKTYQAEVDDGYNGGPEPSADREHRQAEDQTISPAEKSVHIAKFHDDTDGAAHPWKSERLLFCSMMAIQVAMTTSVKAPTARQLICRAFTINSAWILGISRRQERGTDIGKGYTIHLDKREGFCSVYRKSTCASPVVRHSQSVDGEHCDSRL